MFSLPSHVFALYFPKHQFLLQLFRPRLVHAKPQAIEMTTLQRHPVQRPQELVQIVDRQAAHSLTLLHILLDDYRATDPGSLPWHHRDNRCIGTAPRADVRRKNLIHRCSFTMVFKGEVSCPCACKVACVLAHAPRNAGCFAGGAVCAEARGLQGDIPLAL